MADNFDARFSAVKRHYFYRIVSRRADLALDRHRVWRVPRPLDATAMHAAAQRLIGLHDFTTFRAAECQAKSPIKTLDRLDVVSLEDEVRVFALRRGRSCIIRCARWSARWCRSATANGMRMICRAFLEARDRTACGPVAPAEGLYLGAGGLLGEIPLQHPAINRRQPAPRSLVATRSSKPCMVVLIRPNSTTSANNP